MGEKEMRSKNFILSVFLLSVFLLIIFGVSLVSEPPEQSEDEPLTDWFGVSESFIVPAGEHITKEREFSKWTTLTITFNVTKGDDKSIKILVVNESDYLKWINGEQVQSPFPVGSGGAVSGKINFVIPHDANWVFVWDNSYDSTNNKEITALVRYSEHMLDR